MGSGRPAAGNRQRAASRSLYTGKAMGIIFRFILKNIREKKLRSVLIVVAVTISSALYFGTSGMSTTIQQMFANRLKQYFGTAELMIFAKEGMPRFFPPRLPREFSHRVDFAIGVVQASGRLKTSEEVAEITIYGFKLDELQTMNPVVFADIRSQQSFSGKSVIIGRHTAETYGLAVGDSVRMEIQNAIHRFRIIGVAESTGFFTDDGRSNVVIAPRNVLASIFEARGRVSMMYIKAIDPDDTVALLEDLRSEMKRSFVRETVSREDIRQWSQDTAIPFRIMLILTLAMSIFIIFTCFQVITMERLPVIGTFRSIGATRRTTDLVLLSESAMYGIAGGTIGSVLGIGVMYLMTRLNTGGWLGQAGIDLTFRPGQLIQSFFLAIILSCGSSLIPIIRVSKLPVKDVILNTIEHAKGKPLLRIALGIILLLVGLILPFFVPVKASLIIDSVCIILILAATVLLVPLITSSLAYVFERLYRILFGNVGILAAKNLKSNRNLLNNISLLAIGISSLYMINTISSGVLSSLTNLYRDARYDVQVWAWPPDRNLEMQIRTVAGVTETYGIYGAYGIKLPEEDEVIEIMHGIDKNKFGRYWDIQTTGDREALFDSLDEGRNIIMSYTLQKRLNLAEGDRLVLEFEQRKQTYEVIGFFNTLMWNGSYALVGERFLKLDAGRRFYSDLYVKTDIPPEVVADSIKEKLARRRPWVTTVEEMEKRDRESNEDMFLILKGFSMVTLLIGVIGILNNYVLSFIERKRSLALLRSVGMSKTQGLAMLFLEALSGGVVGGASGFGGGLLIMVIIPPLFEAMKLPAIVFYITAHN